MSTPPKQGTPRSRTLGLAAETLGGPQQLAEYLAVPPASVLRWLSGDEYPPPEVFLAALEIVAKGEFAGRTQARADRSQAKADRAQRHADRAQHKADRDQATADRAADSANRSSGDTEQLRQVKPQDGPAAANTPEKKSDHKPSRS